MIGIEILAGLSCIQVLPIPEIVPPGIHSDMPYPKDTLLPDQLKNDPSKHLGKSTHS